MDLRMTDRQAKSMFVMDSGWVTRQAAYANSDVKTYLRLGFKVSAISGIIQDAQGLWCYAVVRRGAKTLPIIVQLYDER